MKAKTILEKTEQRNRVEIEKMKRKVRSRMITSRLVLETELGWKAYHLTLAYGAEAAGMELEEYVNKMNEWGDGKCPHWQFIHYQTTGRDRAIAEMQSSGELAKLRAMFVEFDAHDNSDTVEALAVLAESVKREEQRIIAMCLESKNEQK